ncbi:trimeric intracellular cation channel family protein [Hymenobacter latericus]|uniref:trimeric intracellular cation channel family protein n=1 Tax=Hymenobacter sp. YIM 151858-1 TaxID=2987688 RepID=UPI0022267B5A|nr:trimeric intracellular cation channel family protein [Hymenobacter sp. YIM 151858-1]UYZ60824.1 trimeric intracellular cation channel family protein [Hymenobacter sp. YIM 151858-1]
MSIIYLTDLIGTGVFAISGTLAALHKKKDHDLLTLFIFAFVTAVGGGTLRDVIIQAYPVAWISDANYLVVITASVLIAVACRRWWLGVLQRPLLVFDTLGIGIFTILGLQKALNTGVNAWAAVLLGIVSALFGGVIRDTLANEVPLVFERQLYATPCLTGAVFYVLALYLGLDPTVNFLVAVGLITIFRLLAARNGWALPPIRV